MNSRREFLQKVSLGIGVTTLSGLSASMANPFLSQVSPPGADKQLRVAIMGLGGYANIVAKGMQECKIAKITGVISGTPS